MERTATWPVGLESLGIESVFATPARTRAESEDEPEGNKGQGTRDARGKKKRSIDK